MTHRSRLPYHVIYCFLAVSLLMYAKGSASEQPLKQSVAELKDLVRDLREDNDKLAYEVAKLRRTIQTMETKSNRVQSKGTAVSKVKRVSLGRPRNKDMMVGVTQLMAVWDQMDLIMDKLDEVTAHISQ